MSSITRVLSIVLMALGVSLQAAPVAAQSSRTYSEGSTLRGSVAAFDGKYSLQVRDEQGSVIAVELRKGTVINPVGMRLRSGMYVVIMLGSGSDTSKLYANQIDAPFERRREYRSSRQACYGGFCY